MLLCLENIGKILKAEVELNGITVIAGENNTGKSTVGKVLFCIFNSFYNIRQKIDEERENSIAEILTNLEILTYSNPDGFFSDLFPDIHLTTGVKRFSRILLRNQKKYDTNNELVQRSLEDFLVENNAFMVKGSSDIASAKERICRIISVSDEEIRKRVLQKKLTNEFNAQVNNLYTKETGKIELKIKDIGVEVLIENNEVGSIKNNLDLHTEVIYIDDPFVLDDLSSPVLNYGNYTNHQVHLKLALRKKDERNEIQSAISEIITTKKIDGILKKINYICGGEMVRNRMNFGYQKKDSEVILDVKNISTGLKTFVILKTLLLNSSLKENGTIVLDEPEIHLHPEWQLLFAELIVLLQKEFHMHILLNTHSPYFLRAIQVYSAKYEIADKCKYYLAENVEEQAIVTDVTTDIEQIYARLAKPFEALERERYGDA